MAGVSRWLRDFFIGVNILLEIVAVLMIALAISLHILLQTDRQTQRHTSMVATLWVQAAGISMVASFGIYGVIKSKKWPLIVYITASVIGVAIFLMVGGIWAKMVALVRLHMDPERPPSPIMQGMNMAFLIMLTVNFVPATVGLGGIILAAIILHQLQGQRNVTLDAESQHPECSQLSPIGSK